MGNIEEKLASKCKNCGLRKRMRRCPVDGKFNCSAYMSTLIKAYIKEANDEQLRMVPWELYARGLQAYDMTGDLKQTKYVKI